MKASREIALHIRDNSKISQVKQQDLQGLQTHFGHVFVDWDGVNCPLAKVYNDASEPKSAYEWFVILDDDTQLPLDFLESLVEADRDGFGADIAVPIVRCGDLIVSPGQYNFVKGKHLTEVQRGMLPSYNLVAIASGMAIRHRYIASFPRPFDERLSFYGVDTRFCLDYRDRRPALFVTSATLEHDSALWKSQDKDEQLRRFKLLRQSWFVVHQDSLVKRAAALGLAVLASVKRTVTYRDIRYLL